MIFWNRIKEMLRGDFAPESDFGSMHTAKNIILMPWHEPSGKHVKRMAEMAREYDVIIADSEKIALESAKNAEIIFGQRYLKICIDHAKNLKWLQLTSGGVDQLSLLELMNRGVLLTRSTVATEMIARHAHTLAWALIRKLPSMFAA